MGSKITGWRKIAFAMWRAPDQPEVLGALEVDATGLLEFMERARAAGHRVTPTHLVGRALAHALREVPDVNVRIVGDRVIPEASVDIFFITAVSGGRDLSGAKVERADVKPVVEIAAELTERARALKEDKDPTFAKSKRLSDALPRPVLRAALRLSAFLTGDLGLGIPALGLKPRPFGSAAVTSVGMFGLPMGFAPLSWMYKVPILILAGEITDRPVVIDKRIEVRPVLPLTATIDHRYMDGWHIARLLKPFRAYLASPATFEPELRPAG
jgi:pyruvate dehydrogenase E2 component (dihydrolipoamide acetyltransferase)